MNQGAGSPRSRALALGVDGPTPVGVFVFSPDPAIIEIIAWAGFDFVIIDQEHAPLTIGDVAGAVRVASLAGLEVFVRVTRQMPQDAARALDAGASGIMLPHAGMGDDAAFAAWLRYPRRGHRPTCRGVRAGGYGLGDFPSIARRADDETLLIGQIEDEDAVARLPEILEEGVFDALMPGPSDLASSMGLPGELEHERVTEAVEHIVEQASQSGVPLAAYVAGVDDVETWLDRGVGWLAMGIDHVLLAHALSTLRRDVDAVERRSHTTTTTTKVHP